MEGRWLRMGQRAGSPTPCPGNDSDYSCCKHQARDDEELTNLNWLHESKNLLTAMSLAGQAPAASQAPPVKETPLSPSQTPHKPRDVSKPPYSFNCLIFMAIEGSPAQCLPVKEIYKWILEHYPYFQQAPVGWKNSVRHNLSLNRCFKRVEKDGKEALGKGSFWCIDEESRPNLLQAVSKRTLYIHSAPLGSSAPVLPNTPYTQDTDGELEEQLLNVNQEPGVTATLSHNGTSATVNKKPTLTNSFGLPFLPLRRDSCLKRCPPAPSAVPSGDHNYSLVWAEGWQLCPAVPGDQEAHGKVSVEAASENSDDDSQGFRSADEWEMEDSSEDEEVEDSLADSGYVPLNLRDAPAAEGSEGSPRHRSLEELGFSDIDDELKEVAGSLLHLAGICS